MLEEELQSSPPQQLCTFSQSRWQIGGLDRGYPGVHALVCKSFSLILLLQARKAGEPGRGQPIVWWVSDIT